MLEVTLSPLIALAAASAWARFLALRCSSCLLRYSLLRFLCHSLSRDSRATSARSQVMLPLAHPLCTLRRTLSRPPLPVVHTYVALEAAAIYLARALLRSPLEARDGGDDGKASKQERLKQLKHKLRNTED